MRLTGSAVLATAVAALAAACAPSEDSVELADTLSSHLTYARRDAETAAVLAGARPELADALGIVAAERRAHADALAAEIDRVLGGPSTSSSPAATTATTTAVPPPSLDELTADLAQAQTSAAESARNESGYRAGLLGSISAACGVHLGVVLA